MSNTSAGAAQNTSERFQMIFAEVEAEYQEVFESGLQALYSHNEATIGKNDKKLSVITKSLGSAYAISELASMSRKILNEHGAKLLCSLILQWSESRVVGKTFHNMDDHHGNPQSLRLEASIITLLAETLLTFRFPIGQEAQTRWSSSDVEEAERLASTLHSDWRSTVATTLQRLILLSNVIKRNCTDHLPVDDDNPLMRHLFRLSYISFNWGPQLTGRVCGAQGTHYRPRSKGEIFQPVVDYLRGIMADQWWDEEILQSGRESSSSSWGENISTQALMGQAAGPGVVDLEEVDNPALY